MADVSSVVPSPFAPYAALIFAQLEKGPTNSSSDLLDSTTPAGAALCSTAWAIRCSRVDPGVAVLCAGLSWSAPITEKPDDGLRLIQKNRAMDAHLKPLPRQSDP